MPYQPGAVVHGVTHVGDVYKSNNVYANNVQVALWQPPGTSAAFAFASIASAVDITPESASAISAQTAAYLDNPSAFYNKDAEAGGVKPNVAPVPAATSTGTVAPVAPSLSVTPFATDIPTFLKKILDEADRGMWIETGQKNKDTKVIGPSNPNIINIWKELGFPSSGPWVSDQTAWCMGFVNWVLKKTGYRWCKEAWVPNLPAHPSRWNATSVPINAGQPGDMAVWDYGHVNFIYQVKDGKYSFCGGNQIPSVTQNPTRNPDNGTVNISYPGPIWTQARFGKMTSLWRPSKT